VCLTALEIAYLIYAGRFVIQFYGKFFKTFNVETASAENKPKEYLQFFCILVLGYGIKYLAIYMHQKGI
jgi:hypothetical protein